jgi:hypothetical protein
MFYPCALPRLPRPPPVLHSIAQVGLGLALRDFTVFITGHPISWINVHYLH